MGRKPFSLAFGAQYMKNGVGVLRGLDLINLKTKGTCFSEIGAGFSCMIEFPEMTALECIRSRVILEY